MKIEARLASIKNATDQQEVAKWDAHSAMQLTIISLSANGVGMAVTQFKTFNTDSVDPRYGLSLPGYIRKPVYDLAVSYVEAAAIRTWWKPLKLNWIKQKSNLKCFPLT